MEEQSNTTSPIGDFEQPQQPEQKPSHASHWLWWIVGIMGLLAIIVVAGIVFYMVSESDSTATTTNTNTVVNTNANENANTNLNTNANTNTSTEVEIDESTLGMGDRDTVYVSGISLENEQGPHAIYRVDPSDAANPMKVGDLQDVHIQDVYSDNVIYVPYNTFDLSASGHLKRFQKGTSQADAEKLVDLEDSRDIQGAAVSPDETTLAYVDHCGFACGDGSGSVTIKTYDLATGATTDIYTETGKPQGFKYVDSWLNNDTILLIDGYEATEGASTVPQIYFLDVDSGDLTEFETDSRARHFSASPDGTRVAYTTFTYDEDSGAVESTLAIKYVSGEAEATIRTSTDLEFREVHWITDDGGSGYGSLAYTASTVESVREELGYVVTGTKSIYMINEDNWTAGAIVTDGEPDSILGAGVNGIIYSVTPDGVETDIAETTIKKSSLNDTSATTILENVVTVRGRASRDTVE